MAALLKLTKGLVVYCAATKSETINCSCDLRHVSVCKSYYMHGRIWTISLNVSLYHSAIATGQIISGASFCPDLLVQGLKNGWMVPEKLSVNVKMSTLASTL